MIKFEDIPARLEKTAEENARAIAKAKVIKHMLAHYLALFAEKFDEKSHAAAENKAKASKEYKEKLDEAAMIIAKAEIAKARMKSLEMQFSWYQSMNANERARINM